jgi:FtsZ-binding cell division protein ZapB
MEVLHILEEKIARLIESKKKDMETIAGLKKEISELKKDNDSLRMNIEKLEDSLLAQGNAASQLHQESEQAKVAVDELIGCIDALMKEESR